MDVDILYPKLVKRISHALVHTSSDGIVKHRRFKIHARGIFDWLRDGIGSWLIVMGYAAVRYIVTRQTAGNIIIECDMVQQRSGKYFYVASIGVPSATA